MRLHWGYAGLAVVIGAVLAPSATAGPNEDFQAVYADWKPDGDVTACLFTRAQLVNARNVAESSSAFAYDTRFPDEVSREIARWDSGGCASSGGGSSKKANFKIVKVRGKVRSRDRRKEYVTIKNKGGKTGNLKGWSLRDRSGHRIRFRRKLRLGAGRRLRVVSGCARGHKRPFRRGSRYFACRKKAIWNDQGDVVRLVRPGGKVVSQRGYGRYRSAKRF